MRGGRHAPMMPIHVSDLRGLLIDLRMLSYAFVILEEHGTPCEFALDDIYWDSGTTVAVDDGPRTPASRLRLLANAPNPFNAATEIRFELPSAGAYTVVIHDPGGRRVRTFAGTGQVGLNSVHWDGRNERGASVSSGVYHYQVQTAQGASARSMVLVK